MARLLAALTLVLAGCGGSHAARPTISVSSGTALIDRPPQVVVHGLKPNAATVARASTVDYRGEPFVSRVVVRADASGVLRVPMPRLLTSLHPPGVVIDDADGIPRGGEVLTVAVAGRSVRLHLLTRSPDLEKRELRVRRDGLYGTFYRLPSQDRRPAVLLFGGSEGGLYTTGEAALLASRGFPTLALAYFKEPGLPRTLKDVPLEYFVRALHWLARQPGVDPGRLVVDGYSRGSEAALLVGAYFPELVRAVVAMVPSSVVVCSYPGDELSAWTLQGAPLPCALRGPERR